MGMFDWVKINIYCPYCKTMISGSSTFQSKDADCELKVVSVDDVDSFYSRCPECERWIEYTRDSEDSRVFNPIGWKLSDSSIDAVKDIITKK